MTSYVTSRTIAQLPSNEIILGVPNAYSISGWAGYFPAGTDIPEDVEGDFGIFPSQLLPHAVRAVQVMGNSNFDITHYIEVYEHPNGFSGGEFFPTDFEWKDDLHTYNASIIAINNGWQRTRHVDTFEIFGLDIDFPYWRYSKTYLFGGQETQPAHYAAAIDYSPTIGQLATPFSEVVNNVSMWVDELVAGVTGVPVNSALQVVRSSLREFTRDSEAWIEAVDPIDLGYVENDFWSIPDQIAKAPLRITAMELYDGNDFVRWLTPVDYRSKVGESEYSSPKYFYRDPTDVYRTKVFPIPDKTTYKVVPHFAFMHTGGEVVPEVFRIRWFDAILDGAKGKLFSTPNRPYTNLQLAQYHTRKFQSAKTRARIEARTQFNSLDIPTPFPLVGVR